MLMEERSREGKGRREQPLAPASERTGVISERIRLLCLGSRCHDNLESLSNTARSTLATLLAADGAANVTRQGRKGVPAEDASRSEGETAEKSDRSQEVV